MNIEKIGKIAGCKIANILTNKLRILNLRLDSSNGMCYLNDGRLIITSFDENKLLMTENIFNIDTRIIKEATQILSLKFS
jgi:hypothetical protein